MNNSSQEWYFVRDIEPGKREKCFVVVVWHYGMVVVVVSVVSSICGEEVHPFPNPVLRVVWCWRCLKRNLIRNSCRQRWERLWVGKVVAKLVFSFVSTHTQDHTANSLSWRRGSINMHSLQWEQQSKGSSSIQERRRWAGEKAKIPVESWKTWVVRCWLFMVISLPCLSRCTWGIVNPPLFHLDQPFRAHPREKDGRCRWCFRGLDWICGLGEVVKVVVTYVLFENHITATFDELCRSS